MSEPLNDGALGKVDREAAEWLARLRAGDSREQTAFEDWYSTDAAHADAYDRVLASWEAMGRLDNPASESVRTKRRWRYAVAAAAAVALLGVGLTAIRNSGQSPPAHAIAAATTIGQVRTVDLPDGTRVTLDTQSAIRADFDESTRRVRLLRGRALFNVMSERRPFVIATGTGSVSTNQSLLDVAEDGGQTRVGVVSGTAGFQPAADNAAFVQLSPGQSFRVGRDGAVATAAPFSASDTRWTVGMLSFENAPLSAVIAAANRYSSTQIVLADASLASLKFTGTFKARDTLGLARMIAAMFNLHCDESDPKKLLLSRSTG